MICLNRHIIDFIKIFLKGGGVGGKKGQKKWGQDEARQDAGWRRGRKEGSLWERPGHVPSDSPPPQTAPHRLPSARWLSSPAGPCQCLWLSLHNGVAAGAGAGSSLTVAKTEAQRERHGAGPGPGRLSQWEGTPVPGEGGLWKDFPSLILTPNAG